MNKCHILFDSFIESSVKDILSAIGHNFRRILPWLRALWCLFLTALIAAAQRPVTS